MTASSRIAAVAFDLDGLLVNTEELYQHVGTELLRRRGHSFEPELLDAMMGRPQQVSLKIMIEWHGLADTRPARSSCRCSTRNYGPCREPWSCVICTTPVELPAEWPRAAAPISPTMFWVEWGFGIGSRSC